MEVEALIDQLASTDRQVRVAAVDALVAEGVAAVGPVLAELCNEGSPVDWWAAKDVLERLGDPAFEPLVEAIAAAPTAEMSRRARAAFTGLDVSDAAMYVSTLRHPDPEVRSSSADALSGAEDGLAHASALVPLLADADSGVRKKVVRAFADLGPGVVPLLRRVRRSPGPARRAALTALAEVGGWDALDEVDQTLVERLIRIKISDERPRPMGHLCGVWFALPTSDQAAVLDAFGLSDPMPVTMRMGASAWERDHHNWALRDRHIRCARVYVSPVLDGWTLVFGEPSEDAHAGRDEDDNVLDEATVDETILETARARCAVLSRRFGAAHWYQTSCGDDTRAWCIAEAGEVVRFYETETCGFDPERQIGARHPAEEGYRLPHEGLPPGAYDGVDMSDIEAGIIRRRELQRARLVPETADTTTVAARASLDPSALGPHVRVEGHGVLALTECGRRHGAPPGALDI